MNNPLRPTHDEPLKKPPGKVLIYDLDLPELEARFKEIGLPAYRARQVWQGLYQKLWASPLEFTMLSKDLREKLGQLFEFSHLEPVDIQTSKDEETRKTLFRLPDGQSIEAVLMRYQRRRTLCISTQAGCAMGCVFCATGQMGFRRNLSSGEIVEQVVYYARELLALGESVTNIVVMGMGEPFHNYEATLAAIDRLNHADGLNLGARRFTISTVGLIPMIERFANENRQVNLAISLHAADDGLRSALLPINRKYSLAQLFEACESYVRKTNRRISFEYALIRGVNDSEAQAQQLAQRLQVFRRGQAAICHVNIIPLNPTQQYKGQATTREQAQLFRSILEENGIPCTIRLRRGIDIQAGCGQLATSHQNS
jgi:23S rRNA (adenine2503-C2)-methyltransferase